MEVASDAFLPCRWARLYGSASGRQWVCGVTPHKPHSASLHVQTVHGILNVMMANCTKVGPMAHGSVTATAIWQPTSMPSQWGCPALISRIFPNHQPAWPAVKPYMHGARHVFLGGSVFQWRGSCAPPNAQVPVTWQAIHTYVRPELQLLGQMLRAIVLNVCHWEASQCAAPFLKCAREPLSLLASSWLACRRVKPGRQRCG